jgi:hypothetical protein
VAEPARQPSPEEPAAPDELPPDPEAYDSPRAAQARRKGLKTPYIPGGDDPELEAARRTERRYLRILLAMVVVIVLSGFVLGFIANVLGP